uniref:Telomere repeat binding bouquet formation protein 2 n=1 Tax=Stegastes partitus TaxID=144197 RepID=A0A3B5B6Q9_9TELE
MFRCKTAWFSSSVPQACSCFWMLEGGSAAGWREADYLFSADAACPDTVRIFESKDYLWNKVTVFHSLFLSVCERRQSVKSVSIGHYVLPPASVQDGEDSCMFTDLLSDILNTCCRLQDDNQAGEHISFEEVSCWYVSIDNLQKYSGELCDFHPGYVQCSKCKANIYEDNTYESVLCRSQLQTGGNVLTN